MIANSNSSTFELAVLRTMLANSTAVLSHIQGSIALLISGLGLMKLFDSSILIDFCGWFFLALAAGVFVRGVLLYLRTRPVIEKERMTASGGTPG